MIFTESTEFIKLWQQAPGIVEENRQTWIRAQPGNSLTCGLRAFALHIRERTYWFLAVCKKVVSKGAGEVGSSKGTAVWSELEGAIKFTECSLSADVE